MLTSIVVAWILDNLVDFSLGRLSCNRGTSFLASDPLLLSFGHFVQIKEISLAILEVVLPSSGINGVLLFVFGEDDTSAMLHMILKLPFIL